MIKKPMQETFDAAFAAVKANHQWTTVPVGTIGSTPIDMVLHCPECGVQHIDAPKSCSMGVGCDESGVCYAEAHGEPDRCDAWKNPIHRSHLCSACGFVWRPADVPTNGVASIKTKGKNDDAFEPRHKNTLLNAQVEDFFEGLGASDDVNDIQSAFRSIGLAEDTIKHILTVICRSKPLGNYPGAQSAEKIKGAAHDRRSN